MDNKKTIGTIAMIMGIIFFSFSMIDLKNDNASGKTVVFALGGVVLIAIGNVLAFGKQVGTNQ